MYRYLVLEPATRGALQKKVFLEISQNSQENTCARKFIKKETLAQVLSCDFCEISQNTFSRENLRVSASVVSMDVHVLYLQLY